MPLNEAVVSELIVIHKLVQTLAKLPALMMRVLACCLLCLVNLALIRAQHLPVVINTWPFLDATAAAWETLSKAADNEQAVLDAVEQVDLVFGFITMQRALPVPAK